MKICHFQVNTKFGSIIYYIIFIGNSNEYVRSVLYFKDKQLLPVELKTDRKLRDISNMPQEIPHGQAVVEIKDQSIIPHLTHNNDVIPHKLLQDLHRKIETAIRDLGLTSKKHFL